jgi:hypothetical protein
VNRGLHATLVLKVRRAPLALRDLKARLGHLDLILIVVASLEKSASVFTNILSDVMQMSSCFPAVVKSLNGQSFFKLRAIQALITR